MRVDFVLGGAQKAGTTALAQFIASHPEVDFSAEKEVHFFDDDAAFAEGQPNVADYHRWFDWTRPDTVRGEATPIYMYWDPCPARICRYNPEMKWIVLLRNPIERAYSHWIMESQRGDDPYPFHRAIREEQQRLAASGGQHRHWSYVDRGFYTRQLERLIDLFGQDRVLCLRSEELLENHEDTLGRVWRFLGVEPASIPPNEVFRGQYEPMAVRDREWLQTRFAEEIDRLESILGTGLDSWRGDP